MNKYTLGMYWRCIHGLWERCSINEIMDNTEKSFGVFEEDDTLSLKLCGAIKVKDFVENYLPYNPRVLEYSNSIFWE